MNIDNLQQLISFLNSFIPENDTTLQVLLFPLGLQKKISQWLKAWFKPFKFFLVVIWNFANFPHCCKLITIWYGWWTRVVKGCGWHFPWISLFYLLLILTFVFQAFETCITGAARVFCQLFRSPSIVVYHRYVCTWIINFRNLYLLKPCQFRHLYSYSYLWFFLWCLSAILSFWRLFLRKHLLQ